MVIRPKFVPIFLSIVLINWFRYDNLVDAIGLEPTSQGVTGVHKSN